MATRCVIQSTHIWLPQTMTWLYHQTRNLPGWRSVVMCNDTENLDQFPWPEICSLRDHGAAHYILHRAHKLLGTCRHPPFFERVTDGAHPALIHSHFGPRGWTDMLLARRSSLPHILTFYGVDVGMQVRSRPVWRDRYREMFEHLDAVLCEGPHMASCVEELGCPPEKLRVHHLGVDLELLPFRPRHWNGRDPLRLLCAASFVEKKGLPYAVTAVGMFCRDHPGLDVRLTVIGGARKTKASRREKRLIVRLLDKWELADRTKLLGCQPYRMFIEQAYGHHIFISPSVTAADGDTEGGAPVSIIELAASGMPVISTTHCDIPNVLAEPNRGLLTPERDSRALSSALSDLVARPGDWESIAVANRERIEREFSAKDQGIALAGIYEHVAGLRSRTRAAGV